MRDPPGRYLLLELVRRLQSLRVISRAEARAVYDSNARTPKASNDAESGYGGPASDALARLGGLDDDGELFIVEYGCGRGALARALLRSRDRAGKLTRYVAVDQSAEMAAPLRENLAEFVERGVARVAVVPDGEPSAALALLTDAERERGATASFDDRSTCSPTTTSARAAARARVLRRDGGALCVAGITYGAWARPITVYWALRWEVKRRGGRQTWADADHGPRRHVAREWARARARRRSAARAPVDVLGVLVAVPLG